MSTGVKRARARAHADRAISPFREPAVRADLGMVLRATVATVAAWVLASEVWHLSQPFLAPWTALLTVQSTVHRSVSSGVQTIAASAVGIVLAVVCVQLFGPGSLTLAVAVLVGLLLARWKPVRVEGVTIATTALLVITGAPEQGAGPLLSRFVDVALGAGIGVLVNFIGVPPLAHRHAHQQLERVQRSIGELMKEMAKQLAEDWDAERAAAWIAWTRSMDDDLAGVWPLVRQAQESATWNPRRRSTTRRAHRDYENDLRRLEDAVAGLRAMARTIESTTHDGVVWDTRFTVRWIALLSGAGERVARTGEDPDDLLDSLDEVSRELSNENLPGSDWPLYGALITDLATVIGAIDELSVW